MTSAATLRQWVRYAAEVLSPKTHCGTYPWLMDWPQLKPACLALVRAAEAGESTAIQWEIADEIHQLLTAIRARQAERHGGKATVGKASDVLHKPAEIREREEQMKALRKKVLKAKPMPTLFAAPSKPEKPIQQPDTFFEKGA